MPCNDLSLATPRNYPLKRPKSHNIEALSKFTRSKPDLKNVLPLAQVLTLDSTPEEIHDILRLARKMGAVECRKVLNVIKRKTGHSLDELRDAFSEIGEPGSGDFDHYAFAQAIIERHGKGNLLTTTAHTWRWRESGVWRVIGDRELKKLVQDVFVEMNEKITRGLMDAVTDVLKTELFAPEHEWNRNPDVINFINGEVCYEAGEWALKPHKREHFLTTQIPYAYDPDAKAPRFNKFLAEIFEGDPDAADKARLILEMIGYSLASHCRYEKFILLIGPGANGKSVLLDVLRVMVGPDNVAAVQPSQFSNKFQRAHLHLKLLNLVTEIAEGSQVSDAELKAIVSGELTTVENKHQPPFDFRPYVIPLRRRSCGE